MRLDDGSSADEGRFKGGFTHYEGRRVRLPAFWIGGERIYLSLTHMVQCAHDAGAGEKILRRLAAELEQDAVGVEGFALVLQQRCRELIGWKPTIKRDVKRRRLPPYRIGRG